MLIEYLVTQDRMTAKSGHINIEILDYIGLIYARPD